MPELTICVIGLGYIGLPTAALLASAGYRVFGCDRADHVVETVNRGEVHIVEPDLEAYVRSAVKSGRLSASTYPRPADVYMVCVPTPLRHSEQRDSASGDPTPDLSYVLAATEAIAPLVKPGDMVILESTSPVGTTDAMVAVLAEAGVDVATLAIAYCPERVLPGRIMVELTENARIVGGQTAAAARRVAEFYRSFVRGEVLETDARTGEMCKLVENSFRDVNIAFANELSLLCSGFGIDPWALIALANHHPRVNILQPGVGVGGHCIAVDPWFLVSAQPKNARLIRTARQVNLAKTNWVIEEIAAEAQKCSGPVACLGASFKPDIDDLRESPALDVAHALNMRGIEVLVVEPHVAVIDGLTLSSLDEALGQCGVIAVLVRHQAFLGTSVASELRRRGALDFCGALAD